MKDCSHITLLVPKNDLESVTIAEIAERIGFHQVLISDQPWGAKLEKEPQSTFDKIETDEVWIVEIPGPEKEKELEEQGKKIKAIDHHHYKDAPGRYQEKSSLEQLAEACEYELSEDERMVAINDRAYIWGMLEGGASYETIRKIREQDLDVQLKSAGFKNEDQRKLIFNRIIEECKHEYETKIAPVVCKDPLISRPIFFHTTKLSCFGHLQDLYHLPDEAAFIRYSNNRDNYDRRNLCIFKLNFCDKLESVHFSGSQHYISPIIDGFKDQADQAWAGGQKSYGFGGCKIKPGFSIDKILLDQMPIQKFTSIFLYPFKYSTKDEDKPSDDIWREECFQIPLYKGHLVSDPANSWQLQQNYAEYIYFHDYVRSFLYPIQAEQNGSKKKPDRSQDEIKHEIKYYRYPLAKPALIQLSTAKKKHPLSAFITNISAHLYPGGIGIMAIEVSNMPDRVEDMRDLSIDKNRLICTGEELLLFNNMFRRLYPAYYEKGDFEKDTTKWQWPTQMDKQEFPIAATIDGLGFQQDFRMESAHFFNADPGQERAAYYPTMDKHLTTFLLGKLFHTDPLKKNGLSPLDKVVPVLDDRMLVHTYVAFPDGITKFTNETNHKIFFSYLLYVDNPEGYPAYRYAPEFTEQLLKSNTNQRWTHYKTQIGFCRYASARLFFGHYGYLYRPFISMYYQMYLLAVYYRTRLVAFSSDIGEMARDLPAKGKDPSSHIKEEYRDLHTRFVQFMNRHWFTEVTHQDQGIEEFHLMRQAMDLDAMYQQVKEEIERADELMELYHAKEVERFQTKLGWVGAIFGVLSIVASYFGMDFEWDRDKFHSYLMPAITAFFVTLSVWALMWLTNKDMHKMPRKLVISRLSLLGILIYSMVTLLFFSQKIEWLKALLNFQSWLP